MDVPGGGMQGGGAMNVFDRIAHIEREIKADYPGESIPFLYGVLLARHAAALQELDELRPPPSHALADVPCPFTEASHA